MQIKMENCIMFTMLNTKRDSKYVWNEILPGENKETLWYDYIPFDRYPMYTIL